jgi:hypothetical protein
LRFVWKAREYSGAVRVVLLSLLALALAAPALGADGDPRKALTTEGQAAAKSIVLRKGDLVAGFVAHPSSDDSRPKGARCGAVDESDLKVSGEATSPDFSLDRAGVAVGSSASVYTTVRDSMTAWRRAATDGAVRCFADLVRLDAPKAAGVKIVSAKRIRLPALPATSIAYRVVATMKVAGGGTMRAYFDAVLLRRGAVQSALVVSSLGTPVPIGQERTLAAVLAARMAKAARPKGPVA